MGLVHAMAYDLLRSRGLVDLEVEAEWSRRPAWSAQFAIKMTQWVKALKTPVGVPFLHLFNDLGLLEEEYVKGLEEDPSLDPKEAADHGVKTALGAGGDPMEVDQPPLRLGERAAMEAALARRKVERHLGQLRVRWPPSLPRHLLLKRRWTRRSSN